MGLAVQRGPQLPSGWEPPPPHSPLIPTAQKGYRSPYPAWVQFTNRLPQGLAPASLVCPLLKTHLSSGHWGPPHAR